MIRPSALSGAWRLAAVTLLLLPLLAGGRTPRTGEAAPRPDVPSYRIEVDLDYAAGSLAAHQSVTLTNQTNDSWSDVVFAVTAAALGQFRLTKVSAQGRPAEAALTGSVLRVPLGEPAGPGQTVVIDLDYQVTVPHAVGRFGLSQGILSLGSFYPILNVYRQGTLTADGQAPGWTAHDYVQVGDAFFTEAADYDVTVRLAQPASVAATGKLVGQSAGTWHFQAERIREFALSVSDRYQVESIKVGPTVVAAYYLPEHTAAGQKSLHVAAAGLEWLTDALGEYPYPQLSIVEMAGDTVSNVGQEYPGLVMMSGEVWPQKTDFTDYYSYLLVHEIAHQWFYDIVGSDQLAQPWVDEALVTWLGRHWQVRVIAQTDWGEIAQPEAPVDSSIYEFPANTPYFGVVYRAGSGLIEEVYQAMGDRPFFWALQSYVATYQNRIAAPAALTDFFQSYAPRDLNPILARYLRIPKYRAAAPLRGDFWTPAIWSERASLIITSASPLSRITVLIDNRPVWRGEAQSEIELDARSLPPGDHVVTLMIEDAEGRWVERARRVTVTDPTRPEPTRATTPHGVPSARPVSRFGA